MFEASKHKEMWYFMTQLENRSFAGKNGTDDEDEKINIFSEGILNQ
jgi:hypothetical protein